MTFLFIYAQIAPYHYGKGLNSAYIREAQLQASSVISNSGMVSLLDAGEEKCIHPANKKVAGDRLAYLALSKTYNLKGFPCEGPTLKEMLIMGTESKLTFNNAPNGLTSFGKELKCFELAGPDKIFYPAQAVITPTGITLIFILSERTFGGKICFHGFHSWRSF
ncbi:MAG: hypothetical protein U5L72_03245 [Bacteroidales bacterium]|nr:hypothetical protein [Bacteroidales bacterium]